MRMGLAMGFLKNLKMILFSITVHCKSKMGMKLEGFWEGQSEVRVRWEMELPISKRSFEVLKSPGIF